MSLVSCPECGREVSTHAEACPGCGYPLIENPVLDFYKRRIWFGFRIVIGLLILGAGLFAVALLARSSDLAAMAFGAVCTGILGVIGLSVKSRQLEKSKRK